MTEPTNTPTPRDPWPALPLAEWQDTCTTLHMWSQVVGKIRLALAPTVNHWWHVPLYVSTRGLTTSAMPYDQRTLAIEFDFLDHRLHLHTSAGQAAHVALEPRSVADFYQEVMARLEELGTPVEIWPVPVEVPEAIPFAEDEQHAAYDAEYARRFWEVLTQADRLLTTFRGDFIGKVSPVHFFWGAFDLAVSRFSGRTAPRHPGGFPNVGDWVMVESYSHELSSAGFWPGGFGVDAAFYSYTYPAPEGFAQATVRPEAAYFHEQLGEFVLPYEAVRQADDPDTTLLTFLQDSYAAGADLGHWDRAALERRPPSQIVTP